MKYRVVIPREVQHAIDRRVAHLISEGTPQARLEHWLARLIDRIESLYRWPRRFPVAETVSEVTGYEVRRMNFGEYAIFFRVDDGQKLVEIIAFRHGRQRPWLEE